ncbi:MAG: PDZ domain-containing protein [Planctomycetota bacterium]
MRRPRVATNACWLPAAILLAGCRGPEEMALPPLNAGEVHLATAGPAGAPTVYTLRCTEQTVALARTRHRVETVPYLGMLLSDTPADGDTASDPGLAIGPVIREVQADSPAARAGLRTGDTIVAAGGTPTPTVRLFDELLRSHAPLAEPMALSVRRGRGPESSALDLTVRPEGRPVTRQEIEITPLEDVASDATRHGLLLATIPPEASLAIFGSAHPHLVVADVFVGSPAWRAGLRAGDRIVSVEGLNTDSARALAAYLLARSLEERGDTVGVEVEGVSGPYTAALELSGEATRMRFHLPLIVDVETEPRSAEWSMLLFLVSFRSQVEASPVREARSRWKLSLLAHALGIERQPDGYEVTLLWLIHFRLRP